MNEELRRYQKKTTTHFIYLCENCRVEFDTTNQYSFFCCVKCARNYYSLKGYDLKKFIKKTSHHPLKPWDDPESLFCSPNLKEIIGKEPLKGDECK